MFYGHRSILAAHSNYFASILIDNDVPPYKITDVTLTNVNADYFKLFLHFAYTGDVFVGIPSFTRCLLVLCFLPGVQTGPCAKYRSVACLGGWGMLVV